ncbi:MAG: cell division protein FtsW [Candidatus Zambryskibacteria bacterium]|nr:cell division protein FtsW [Candidatus Zambryskibacteria bacterium]
MKKLKVDIPFLVSIFILVGAGYLIFSSASLGLLSSQTAKYANVAFNQTFFGLFLGVIACIITSQIDYKIYRKYAFYIYIIAVLFTLAVFIPGLGVEYGGAHRWIKLGLLSFQPSEFLKIGFIIFLSAWIASVKDKARTFRYGLLPFIILTFITGVILLIQPDTDTFAITVFAGIAIYIVGGGRWRYILILGIIGIMGVGVLAYTRPYVKSRITTFIYPSMNSLSSGYQIQQSLIAVGSGGIFGRGFGQSIQKFNVLPEPIGDSIFAVASEEFGFVGAVSIILLFIFFAFRGLKIANKVPDSFGRLMVVGIVIMITSQAFVNIGAMVGVLPLSGITLPFISHGGTALFMTLAEVGIILNISKNQKKA